MERIKKWCYWTFILLLAISMFVFLLLANYYYCENKSSIISFYNGTCLLSSSWFWSMITAIATAIAAVCAYRAYNESITMRKHSSFDLLFTQLLSNMQSYINKATLQTTIVKAPWVKVYNRDYNTFLNFCNIYTNYTNKKGAKLDEREITELWKVYTMNLVNRSDFSNCFKYFYHIVDTVCQSPLDDARKKQYIGIIQAQLNYDILFCYFINLIAASHGQDTEYCTKLKQYKFFKNLFEGHNGYRQLIRDTVPIYIIEKIYKDK